MTNSIHAITVRDTGGPEVLVWDEAEVGAPQAGEVRLRHTAVGLNFIDVYHRTGFYPLPLPFIPGVEAAGEIEQVGAGVTDLKVGDRVAYVASPGAYSEARVIAADRVVLLPPEISFEVAAASMLKGMTAHMLLRRVYNVKAGDTILIHAAAGGTGLMVCQWAAALGATVIGTVSTAEKAEFARKRGCHHPLIVPQQDWVAEVQRLTDGKKLPVVYDSIGRATFLHSLDCLRSRGLMVTFGQSSGPVDPIDPVVLSQKGSLFLTRPLLFGYIAQRDDLRAAASALFGMISSGKVRVEINQRFKVSDAAAAHEALQSRSTIGSSVLTL